MKKSTFIFIIILILIGVLIWFFFIRSSDKIVDGRYYNKDEGFSIKLPDGWVDAEVPRTAVSVNNPERTAAFGVVAQKVPENTTLEQFIQNFFSQATGTDLYELERDRVIIDGTNGYRIKVSMNLGDAEFITLYYDFIKKNKAYSILCNMDANKFVSYQNDCKEFAASFRFE